jgi:hypothetical protein
VLFKKMFSFKNALAFYIQRQRCSFTYIYKS